MAFKSARAASRASWFKCNVRIYDDQPFDSYKSRENWHLVGEVLDSQIPLFPSLVPHIVQQVVHTAVYCFADQIQVCGARSLAVHSIYHIVITFIPGYNRSNGSEHRGSDHLIDIKVV